MAEGWARFLGSERFDVYSAGARPNPKGLHPLAVRVMKERGIEISQHHVKGLDSVPSTVDIVVTVCDEAAASCPHLRGRIMTLHWPIPDPVVVRGSSEQEELEFFRSICADLERRVSELY